MTGPYNYFDPLWQVLNDAGVVVTFHVSEANFMHPVIREWGELPLQSRKSGQTAWQWMFAYSEIPVMMTLASFIYWNFFERFPNIKMASVENGAEWLPRFLYKMDKMRGMARSGFWPMGQLKERPSTIFKRHCFVVAYPEDDIKGIVDQLGGDAGCLLMGSDYPHAEGVARPRDFVAEGCKGIPKLAKFHGLRTDNGPDQVPIRIEKVNRTTIHSGGGVKSCGDGNVITDRCVSRAKDVPNIWSRAYESPEKLAGRPIKEIDGTSIVARKVLPRSRDENIVPKACHRITEEVAGERGPWGRIRVQESLEQVTGRAVEQVSSARVISSRVFERITNENIAALGSDRVAEGGERERPGCGREDRPDQIAVAVEHERAAVPVPSDKLGHKVASLLIAPSETRARRVSSSISDSLLTSSFQPVRRDASRTF